MSPKVISLFYVLLEIIIYFSYVAIPMTMLIGVMYVYQRYMKYRDKEVKEAERIIVRKNEDINASNITLSDLEKRVIAKQAEYDLINKLLHGAKQAINSEPQPEVELDPSGDEPKVDAEEIVEQPVELDYEKMNIKELQAVAKARSIKGYSRLNKETLLSKLKV